MTVLDTTYLLPLAKIDVDTDLLRAIAENRSKLRFDDVTISLISIFELQAKAAKLRVPAGAVNDAVEAIAEGFEVAPFADPEVVKLSFELRQSIPDYVDCVIVATAAARDEDLVSEDTRIWEQRRFLHEKYGLQVFRYSSLAPSSRMK